MASETLKNRIRNVLYTTSGKYDTEVSVKGDRSFTDTEKATIADVEAYTKMGLTNEEALGVSLAGSGHEGAHIKYSEPRALVELLQEARSEGADLDVLNNMCQITEDFRVDSRATEERKGYADFRRQAAKAAVKLFKDAPSGVDPRELEMKAISFLTNGINLADHNDDWKAAVDWDRCGETAKELMGIAKESKTSTEALKKVKEVYYRKYHRDADSEESAGGDGSGDKPEKEVPSKVSKGKPRGKSTKRGEDGEPSENEDEDYDDPFDWN